MNEMRRRGPTDKEIGRLRELLREVTDLFFVSSGNRSERETALFDDVLRTVAAEMQEGVLIELARRFADADDAPVQLMRDLANHALPISEPSGGGAQTPVSCPQRRLRRQPRRGDKVRIHIADTLPVESLPFHQRHHLVVRRQHGGRHDHNGQQRNRLGYG